MKKIMSGHYQGPSSRPQPASTPGTQGKDAVLGAMHIMEAKYNLFSRFISLVRSVHPESGKQSSSTKLSDMVYHNLNTTQSATVYCELWQFGKLCKTKLMENHKNRRNRNQYHYLGYWKLSHYSTATKFTRWETKRSKKCWVSNNYSYNSVSGNHKKCYSLQWALSFKPNSTIFEVPTWILIFEWIWKMFCLRFWILEWLKMILFLGQCINLFNEADTNTEHLMKVRFSPHRNRDKFNFSTFSSFSLNSKSEVYS